MTRIRPLESLAKGIERHCKSAIPMLSLLHGHGMGPFKSYPSSDVPDTQLFMHHCKLSPPRWRVRYIALQF
jgi:hypothetical protein